MIKRINILVLFLIPMLIVCGCENDPQFTSSSKTYSSGGILKTYFPKGSSDIRDLGLGWYEFTWEGKKFLYHKEHEGYRGFESLTQIID